MKYLGQQAATYANAEQVVRINAQKITSNTNIDAGWNGSSAGTITIPSGIVVTIASGSRWVIL